MADTMTLYHPETGAPTTFDPAEYDSSAMLRDGYTRQAPRITVKEHQRSRPQLRRGKSGLEKAADWLPAAGGMVGGIVGGLGGTVAGFGVGGVPGAIGGAGVGGAGGEALRQLIYDLDPSQIPTDNLAAPKRIAQSGGEQAVAELVGQGATPLLKGAAHVGMGAALRFTPEVAQTAVQEGIAATRGGVKKVMEKLGEFGQRKLAMLRQNTTRFDPLQLLRDGWPALQKEVADNQTGLAPAMYDQYIEETRKFMARHAPNGVLKDMNAVQLDKFRKDAFELADPIFKRIANNEQVTLVDKALAKWHYAMGQAAKDALEKTTPTMVDPATGQVLKLADVNARTGRLIALKEALVPDVRTSSGLGSQLAARAASPAGRMVAGATLGAGAGAAVPGGNNERDALIGALLGAGVASPQVMSLLALALAHRGTAAVAGQVPRLVMQAAHE